MSIPGDWEDQAYWKMKRERDEALEQVKELQESRISLKDEATLKAERDTLQQRVAELEESICWEEEINGG
jgi:hypothetical protein